MANPMTTAARFGTLRPLMLHAPSPLTPARRRIFWTLALVCALSRLMAISRSLWDWDEALFSLGMRGYDVARHHPHPPGFPLFIALARVMRLVAPTDFHALQSVAVISSFFLFPALFFLARTLDLSFSTSILSGLLCAFFPNVWFFGGTAFSDLPSVVLVLVAVAALFRGAEDRRWYFAGSFLLALAIGIRPQNLLVGLFPGALATWFRWRARRTDVLLAAVIGVVTVALCYGPAIAVTGWGRYFAAVAAHRDYIWNIDSFRSAQRPPLWRIADRFFVKQYASPPLSIVTSILVLISTVGAIRSRDRRIGFLAAAFAPFCLVAWTMLDRFSISRFSIGYIPLFAVLAGDGIRRVAMRVEERLGWRGLTSEAVLAGLLTVAFAVWTLPALAVVRRTISPPLQAIAVTAEKLNPTRDRLYVAYSMVPYVEYFLPSRSWLRVLDERALPLDDLDPRPAFLLTEHDYPASRGYAFTRHRDRLWNIARRHYFDVSIAPVDRRARFGAGWYQPERAGTDEWRWMGAHSVTLLPATRSEAALRLNFDVPAELLPLHPQVTIKLNGTVIESFPATHATETRDYSGIASDPARSNVLELSIDRTLKPKKGLYVDPRELGLMLRFLSFGPV
jgi:hypothetical protein